jgi:MYXO-CTERM domain-containing protein
MKIALLALVATAGIAQADIITRWNFNSVPNDNNTATGTLTPSVGTGTTALVGGTTATFASGDASGGSSDPQVGDDSAWNVTNWAAQGAGSGTRGAAFFGSTVGFFDIIVTFDQRHSNSVSRWFAFEYTTDAGATWTNAATFEGNAGDTWFNNRTVDLSAVSAVENNPNFGFRVVAIFAPGTSAYASSNATAAYATTGTARFDMVTINGVVPTPGALALAGIGGLLAARRRRA